MIAATPRPGLVAVQRWLSTRNRVWLLVSWLALAVAIVLVWRHGTDAGVSWDEMFHIRYGKRLLGWFRTDGQDDSALHYKNLYLYGGLFDVVAAWASERSPLGPFETRHLLTAFLALLGVVGSWKLAALAGGPLAGVLAAVMLVLTPAWLGHGLFNPKDIPFGTGAIWAAYTATRLGVGPIPLRWRDVLFAGVGLGIALAFRPGGFILVGYPFAAVGLRLILEVIRRRELRARWLLDVTYKPALIVALAYPLMLSTWPWARISPFDRPFEAFEQMMNFTHNGEVLYRGEFIHAHDLPRDYLPRWFAMTLPETYLLALACALANLWHATRDRAAVNGRRVIAVTMIAIAAFLPLIAALVLHPVVYDGQRHFLFILPPLASLAGVALATFFRDAATSVWLRRAVGTAWIALCVMTSVDMKRLHPYEYVYFNRLSGGLKAASGQFETDYWGVAYKEALAWIVKHVQPVDPNRRTRIASCNNNSNERMFYYLERWPSAKEKFEIVKDYKRADLYVAMTRHRCHQVPGEVLRTVRRQGVPLVYIIRTAK
jgi:hypothetical protein